MHSALALGLNQDAEDYGVLKDTVLRQYLKGKAEESKESVNLATLDEVVECELKMDMADKNAKPRMESLFVAYHALLNIHSRACLLRANQKVAVLHVLSAVNPRSHKDGGKSDLKFAYNEYKKDFRKFISHAIRVSMDFQLVDNGPKNSNSCDGAKDGRKSRGNNHKNYTAQSPTKSQGGTGKLEGNSITKRTIPDCPHAQCKSRGLKHYIKACSDSTYQGKQQMFAEIATAKQRDGPSRSTRSQTSTDKPVSLSAGTSNLKGTTGRITQDVPPKLAQVDTPSCPISVSDGTNSLDAQGRCDDGSDDSIVSANLAERAAIMGIGKTSAIKPVRLCVALKSEEEAQTFSFSRSWTSLRTVLHLASGQLALANVTFLAADDNLVCEDLLIGLPVSQHLQVDTGTLLENNRSVLDGADCSSVANPTLNRGGSVTRMMICLLYRIQESETRNGSKGNSDRPLANYYRACQEEDPFPGPSLLDSVDSEQGEGVCKAVEEMQTTAPNNGLPEMDGEGLETLVSEHVNIFRTSFSSGLPAKIKPLRIELTPHARPTKVRLRNYSQEQKEFLTEMIYKLIRHGMAYANPMSAWACAPLPVPKPGPARLRFTVDVRPVNKFTVKHQFPMPNIEHGLSKLTGSRYFATFDLSHGYW